MFAAIKYSLSHLLDFSGRDARQTSWFYALGLLVLYFGLSMLSSIVLIGSVLGPLFEIASSGLPEPEMDALMDRRMGEIMGRSMTILLWSSMAGNLLMYALLAAAFVRRLHDSESSGWWAILVLASVVVGTLAAVPMMNAMPDIMAQGMSANVMEDPAAFQRLIESQSRISSYGFLGWIGPLLVIGFGVMPSTDGPNRFGDAPVRF